MTLLDTPSSSTATDLDVTLLSGSIGAVIEGVDVRALDDAAVAAIRHIGFWDNRTTQHAVVGDFGGAHRVIQRVTLRGDEPR